MKLKLTVFFLLALVATSQAGVVTITANTNGNPFKLDTAQIDTSLYYPITPGERCQLIVNCDAAADTLDWCVVQVSVDGSTWVRIDSSSVPGITPKVITINSANPLLWPMMRVIVDNDGADATSGTTVSCWLIRSDK